MTAANDCMVLLREVEREGERERERERERRMLCLEAGHLTKFDEGGIFVQEVGGCGLVGRSQTFTRKNGGYGISRPYGLWRCRCMALWPYAMGVW